MNIPTEVPVCLFPSQFSSWARMRNWGYLCCLEILLYTIILANGLINLLLAFQLAPISLLFLCWPRFQVLKLLVFYILLSRNPVPPLLCLYLSESQHEIDTHSNFEKRLIDNCIFFTKFCVEYRETKMEWPPSCHGVK